MKRLDTKMNIPSEEDTADMTALTARAEEVVRVTTGMIGNTEGAEAIATIEATATTDTSTIGTATEAVTKGRGTTTAVPIVVTTGATATVEVTSDKEAMNTRDETSRRENGHSLFSNRDKSLSIATRQRRYLPSSEQLHLSTLRLASAR